MPFGIVLVRVRPKAQNLVAFFGVVFRNAKAVYKKSKREGVSSQVKCLIPISQRAAKAVRAKTLRVLVVFCGAAPPVFRLPDGLIYVSFHSHSQFDFF